MLRRFSLSILWNSSVCPLFSSFLISKSLAQLTFKDEIDMFYVANREQLRGGVRTTVYNNDVRVDNVQHNLMAIIKILAAFRPGDFRSKDTA